ncbi:MAG: hypothetical protein QM750_16410 [Rubrivivax sp.]
MTTPRTPAPQAQQTAKAAPVAGKAVVLGQVRARGGKVYCVLAPAMQPKHLSAAELDRAVELMVAAR